MKIRTGPSGVQFFNRQTGLTILAEEVQTPTIQWSRDPRHVSIALTNACDLHCRHCFVDKGTVFLDADIVAKWLMELDLHGCLSIGFGGGEPTLHPYFVDLCRFAAEKTGLAVTCTTHGHHFGSDLLLAISRSLHFIRVSMDGVDATYEAIRQRSFHNLCMRIIQIKSHFCFGINYLVNAQTLPDLDRAVQLSANLGASQFLLLPEQSVNGLGGIDEETNRGLHNWVSRYNGRVPLSVSELGADGLPTCNPLSKDRGLRSYAHIDAHGTLKYSSFDSNGTAITSAGIIEAITKLIQSTGREYESME